LQDNAMGRGNAKTGANGVSHSHQHSAQAGRDDGRYRRIEIITGTERRRRWPADAKARITAESFAPDVSVSEVARRHGVSLGLLHHWRRRAREKGRVETLHFVPIAVTDEAPVAAPLEISPPGMIEIDMSGVRIRLSGAVDGAALRTVLAAMRGTV
jgi:transposase